MHSQYNFQCLANSSKVTSDYITIAVIPTTATLTEYRKSKLVWAEVPCGTANVTSASEDTNTQYTVYILTALTDQLCNIPGGAKKTSRTFAGIIHPSSRNVSVQKHVCNDQTSLNMCRNFRLKHFSISDNTNKIASHAIKQFLQAVHHLRCRLYAGCAKTSQ